MVALLRYAIYSVSPEGIIKPAEMAEKWFTDNTWLARLSLFILPFVHVYNLILWLVFGVVTVINVISFIINKLAWLLRFVWNEVLHPTVFWLAKLIWHYPISFAWWFFQFAFRNIGEVFVMQGLRFTFIRLLVLGAITSLMVIAYLLYPNPITMAVGMLVFVFFLQYTIFKLANHYRNDFGAEKIRPSMQALALWLLIAIVAAALMAGVRALDLYAVSAFGLTLGQIAIPLSVLCVFSLLTGILYLAPYMRTVPKLDFLDYLKQMVSRFPKFYFAQPFQYVGILITGALPVAAMILLNFGISETTGRGFLEWGQELVSISNLYPRYANLSTNEAEIAGLTAELNNPTGTYPDKIAAMEGTVNDVSAIKNEIVAGRIHTFRGEALVGERQFFSVSAISQCDEYKWEIEREGTKVFEQSIPAREDNRSVVLVYQWPKEGTYTVSFTPKNFCGNGEPDQVTVNVLSGKKSIGKPQGKTQLCVNDEVVFATEGGYSSYEWRHPFGETTTSEPRLTLFWGNASGTIQVRGVDSNGVTTLWQGTNVYVKGLPGSEIPAENFRDDEVYALQRDFTFGTIEAALDSLDKLAQEKNRLQAEWDAETARKENRIATLKRENANNTIPHLLYDLLGRVLACIGLVLALALTFSTILPYVVMYHFDLYDFKQEGPHYWKETLNEMKERNPNQPLFGFFILLCVAIPAFFAIGSMVAAFATLLKL